MKTATIDYADYEMLLQAAVYTVGVLEGTLPLLTEDKKPQTESYLANMRGALERAMTGVTVGVRAKSFQDRLNEAIAAAKAKA